MGRTGSGVRVSASFEMFSFRMLLHSGGGVTSGVDFLYEVISAGDISRLSYIMARGHGARFAVLYFVVIFVAV